MSSPARTRPRFRVHNSISRPGDQRKSVRIRRGPATVSGDETCRYATDPSPRVQQARERRRIGKAQGVERPASQETGARPATTFEGEVWSWRILPTGDHFHDMLCTAPLSARRWRASRRRRPSPRRWARRPPVSTRWWCGPPNCRGPDRPPAPSSPAWSWRSGRARATWPTCWAPWPACRSAATGRPGPRRCLPCAGRRRPSSASSWTACPWTTPRPAWSTWRACPWNVSRPWMCTGAASRCAWAGSAAPAPSTCAPAGRRPAWTWVWARVLSARSRAGCCGGRIRARARCSSWPTGAAPTTTSATPTTAGPSTIRATTSKRCARTRGSASTVSSPAPGPLPVVTGDCVAGRVSCAATGVGRAP